MECIAMGIWRLVFFLGSFLIQEHRAYTVPELFARKYLDSSMKSCRHVQSQPTSLVYQDLDLAPTHQPSPSVLIHTIEAKCKYNRTLYH